MRGEQYKYKKNKIIKFITVLILIVVGVVLILKIGVQATSSPSFCASCHSMSPQVFTWEAASHSEVKCTNCHIAPGIENLVKENGKGIKRLYNNITGNYLAPIRMPSLIPNESCQTCHQMPKRNVSASGDIIIDHEVHEIKEVACVICHSGVAHGKVAEKRVTYKSDYAKWNEMLAKRFMEDTKYTRPQMETCMDCHEVKKAPLTCDTCHSTSMLPEEHKAKEFITKQHMEQAKDDILYCDTCHSYTTKTHVEGLKGKNAYVNYLSGEKSTRMTVTVEQYAKTNDYCKTCHGIRPDSHNQNLFLMKHGQLANVNQEKCMTCHDNRVISDAPVTNVGCASCHPSAHSKPWKERHPVEIANNQKFGKECLQCHIESACVRCHSLDVKREN